MHVKITGKIVNSCQIPFISMDALQIIRLHPVIAYALSEKSPQLIKENTSMIYRAIALYFQ
jgi:hypothetical protein